MNPEFLKRRGAPALAYVHSAPASGSTRAPVLFCGGYRSDMNGTKAQFLESQCRARGQGFARFDYRGHGRSEGVFEESFLGQWVSDAADIWDYLFPSQRVCVVGSSMGGWIMLRLAQLRAERLAAMIGIAAAPDFTKDVQEKLSVSQRSVLQKTGTLRVPNDYSDQPYYFSRAFFEEAEKNFVLDQRHDFSCPLHLLQGKLDKDVPWPAAERIQNHFARSPVSITYIEDGDHRLSRPQELALLDEWVMRLSSGD